MTDKKKLIAWGILGLSLLLWVVFRHQHPMVTPVLLGATVLALLRELELFRGRRLPLYAGVAVMIANAFLPVDQNAHLLLALLSMTLLALSYWSREKAKAGTARNPENRADNDT